jgi:hypothetical protein
MYFRNLKSMNKIDRLPGTNINDLDYFFKAGTFCSGATY